MHLLPGFEFLKIKSVLYDTDNTPKNVTGGIDAVVIAMEGPPTIRSMLTS